MLDPSMQKIMAPTGVLRAALYPGTPTSVLEPQAREPRGVGYELGRELAQQLGVAYEPVIYAKNADVQDAMRTAQADVAFTNASPARQQLMDFGPPYLLIELGYLVQATSRIAASADIDRTSIRVGAAAGSTSEKTLSQLLTKARVVSVPTNQAGAERLSAGEIEAFATNKATLFELSARFPGLRVLPERWGEERHAIAIPKGRAQGLAFITLFTTDILRRGLVTDAMERAGLRGAVAADAP